MTATRVTLGATSVRICSHLLPSVNSFHHHEKLGVIEAGLGRGYRDFRTIRLHTLPFDLAAARRAQA